MGISVPGAPAIGGQGESAPNAPAIGSPGVSVPGATGGGGSPSLDFSQSSNSMYVPALAA